MQRQLFSDLVIDTIGGRAGPSRLDSIRPRQALSFPFSVAALYNLLVVLPYRRSNGLSAVGVRRGEILDP